VLHKDYTRALAYFQCLILWLEDLQAEVMGGCFMRGVSGRGDEACAPNEDYTPAL
jgi:hypothetical protein